MLWLAVDMDMGGMDMSGLRMIPAGLGIMAPASAPWRMIEFAFVFVMWLVMMVGMMAPSAAPMILMYARAGRQAATSATPFAPTGWFVAGYFLAWTAFSLVATFVQWALERAVLLDASMASASRTFGGIVLIAAGAYQWSALKDVCLAQCQTPLDVPDAPRRLSARCSGLLGARAASRHLLCRLLLGVDGVVVRSWRDERALDRSPCLARPLGEDHFEWATDRTLRRHSLHIVRCVATHPVVVAKAQCRQSATSNRGYLRSPLGVRRVDFVMSALCPVCTQHQTFSEPNGTSHLGQMQTCNVR